MNFIKFEGSLKFVTFLAPTLMRFRGGEVDQGVVQRQFLPSVVGDGTDCALLG